MCTFRFVMLSAWWTVAAVVGSGEIQAADLRPAFARDIVPMFTKLGCNTTACHNALKGKGGLKLSPLGSDLQHDFDALARSDSGRRVSRINPHNSLLLKRLSGPMTTVRLKPESEGYRLFHAWMAGGARGPGDSDPHVVELSSSVSRVVLRQGESRPIEVKARWSDGVVADVTRWCRFEISDVGKKFASISELGKITALEPGRSIIRIRYLKKVAAVDVLVGLETDQRDWLRSLLRRFLATSRRCSHAGSWGSTASRFVDLPAAIPSTSPPSELRTRASPEVPRSAHSAWQVESTTGIPGRSPRRECDRESAARLAAETDARQRAPQEPLRHHATN